MHTAMSIGSVHLQNRLRAQLSPMMQVWVRQVAQQIARSGRFGRWEEMRLNEAMRQKLSQISPPPSKEVVDVSILILGFLTRADVILSREELLKNSSNSIGDDAQLANVELQNMLQKQQQTLQTISSISKLLHDTAMSVVRKIGG
jgi:hypothetical protein